MSFTRRSCVSLVGASIVGQGIFSGSVNANTTVTVRGKVESAIGASVDGSLVEFISPRAEVFEKVPIEDGMFETTLEGDARYHITFWHETNRGNYKTQIDGVPLHYDLKQDFQIGDEDVDLGTFEIPEGHEVQVRFEDPNGNSVEGLHIGFSTGGGSGTGPQSFFTNEEGYVYNDNENDPGVELVSDIEVEVLSPRDHTNFITPRRLSVTEPQDVTVRLQNPEEWGGTVVESDTTTDGSEVDDTESGTTTDGSEVDDTESGTTTDGSEVDDTESGTTTDGSETDDIDSEGPAEEHRGFVTNDPDSSLTFLDDPVTLTWTGIFVSILGITVQLLGRN